MVGYFLLPTSMIGQLLQYIYIYIYIHANDQLHITQQFIAYYMIVGNHICSTKGNVTHTIVVTYSL